MKEPKFVLKQTKNEDEDTLIFLYVRIEKKKLYFSTGEKVKPKNWSPALQRVLAKSPRYQIINHRITLTKKIYDEELAAIVKSGNEITAEELKYKMEVRFGRKEEEPETIKYSMFDYFQLFYKKMERERGYQSAKSFNSTINHLEKFNPKMDWEDINMKTYLLLIDFFRNKNMTNSTIGAYLKRIKTMVRRAKAEGITDTVIPDGWKRIAEDTEAVALTDEEVDAIYDLEIKKGTFLDKVRDMFVLGCRTGLRSGNFLKIDPKKDVIDGMMNISAIKGGGIVTIPMHWQVEEILEKYEWELPKMTNQSFNRRVKDLAKEANLNGKVKRQFTKGGKKTTDSKEKWELISSHTARRSFATQMYLLGFKPVEIMSITGHKSLNEFMKYIRIDREQNAKKMAAHPHFKKKEQKEKPEESA